MHKLTTQQFIEKAVKTHGDKYDYSLVEYKNAKDKIIIICKDHGEFTQRPNDHLMGKGCFKCGVESRIKLNTKSQNKFIEDARIIHGYKYDYSLVKYKNALTKVIIICSKHGEFLQRPHDHFKGTGCKKCGIELGAKTRTLDTQQFIEKAKKVHGEIYDYSKADYKDSHNKIIIICPKHGEFKQIPGNHLQGNGCPKCVGKNKTTQDVIAEFTEIHGDKYDYSFVEYKNDNTKVVIICPQHGKFSQVPSTHLQGAGCKKCGIESTSILLTKSLNKFMEDANKIHNNYYDYSFVEYKNSRTKIIIICPKHGEFLQIPSHHLQRKGCPKCVNKNETKTGEILTELLPNIRLERQLSWNKIFRIKSNKRVDFSFEKEKQKYIVEYNGEQHYFPVKFGKMTSDQSEKKFKNQQLRDRQLKDLCDQHNINLIEIDGRKYQGSKIKDYLIQCFSS